MKTNHIAEERDEELWDEAVEQQESARELLNRAAASWAEIQDFLEEAS